MLRITGGTYRGHKVSSPINVVRPTSSKTKQALFNVLGDIQDCCFCDVYAGTGLVGIEALSRGAKHCTFVENHFLVFQQLKKTMIKLTIPREQYELVKLNAQSYLAEKMTKTYNIVFVDPPFQHSFEQVYQNFKSLVSQSGTLVIQYPSQQTPLWLKNVSQIKTYGESSLAFVSL